VQFEASTKPPIHNLIHEFLINMVFTMACPNFKKGLKMTFGPLGVKPLPHTKSFKKGKKHTDMFEKTSHNPFKAFA
jgi:hypothetical protein